MPSRFRSRNKRSATYFSPLKEFFNRIQLFCMRPSPPSKPHAQNRGGCSNARRDFIEAKIGVFNELLESFDECLFAGFPSFLGARNKVHESVLSERDCRMQPFFSETSSC